MNNKPVSWITPPENVWTECMGCGQRVTGDSIHTCSPQLKELTDEEIMEVFKGVNLFTTNMVEIARAILKKAQKK